MKESNSSVSNGKRNCLGKVWLAVLLSAVSCCVVWAQSQESDLIKGRISLAPNQKRILERYDAPGADNPTAAANAVKGSPDKPAERLAKQAARNSAAKDRSDNEPAIESNMSVAEAHQATGTVAQTTFSSVSTNSNVPPNAGSTVTNSSSAEPRSSITLGFSDFFTNPSKFVSAGMEYLVIGTLLVLILLKLTGRFRANPGD